VTNNNDFSQIEEDSLLGPCVALQSGGVLARCLPERGLRQNRYKVCARRGQNAMRKMMVKMRREIKLKKKMRYGIFEKCHPLPF
jgi:hypothetical protein